MPPGRPRNPYRLRDPDRLRQLMDATPQPNHEPPAYTVRTLAADAGTSRTALSDMLTGKQPRVTEQTAAAIADTLGVPLEELFEPTAE